MKPININPSILLADGAPVRCNFYILVGIDGMEYCETDATITLSDTEITNYHEWIKIHKKHIVWIDDYGRNTSRLCDTHYKLFYNIGAFS